MPTDAQIIYGLFESLRNELLRQVQSCFNLVMLVKGNGLLSQIHRGWWSVVMLALCHSSFRSLFAFDVLRQNFRMQSLSCHRRSGAKPGLTNGQLRTSSHRSQTDGSVLQVFASHQASAMNYPFAYRRGQRFVAACI